MRNAVGIPISSGRGGCQAQYARLPRNAGLCHKERRRANDIGEVMENGYSPE